MRFTQYIYGELTEAGEIHYPSSPRWLILEKHPRSSNMDPIYRIYLRSDRSGPPDAAGDSHWFTYQWFQHNYQCFQWRSILPDEVEDYAFVGML